MPKKSTKKTYPKKPVKKRGSVKRKAVKRKAIKKPVKKVKKVVKKPARKPVRKKLIKKVVKGKPAKKIKKKAAERPKKTAKRRPAKKVTRKRPVKKLVKKSVKKKPVKKVKKIKVAKKTKKTIKKTRKPVGKRVKKPAKPRRVLRSGFRSPRRKSGVSGKRLRKKPMKKQAKSKKRKIVKKQKSVKKRVVKKTKKTRPKPRALRRQRTKLTARRKPRRRKKTRTVRRIYSGGGPLEQLFESPTKIQVMKLFFRNPEENFLSNEAAKIMRMNLAMARKQMKRLEKIGLLKSRRISSKKQVFAINPNFDFFNELRELILKASPISKERMLKAIKGLGKIKLVLLSGLFVGNDPAVTGQGVSRADLLLVGDNINQRKLNTFIKNLEAEAGTDINCVVMTTEEFNYRYDMYDRFVRDLLNEKCELLINRLNI